MEVVIGSLCQRAPRYMICACSANKRPDWRVYRVTDRGPREHYRYRVEGFNLNCTVEGEDSYGRRFSWYVPSIDDPRYDVTTMAVEWVTL